MRPDESAHTGSVSVMFQNTCSEVSVSFVGRRLFGNLFIVQEERDWQNLKAERGVSREAHPPCLNDFKLFSSKNVLIMGVCISASMLVVLATLLGGLFACHNSLCLQLYDW